MVVMAGCRLRGHGFDSRIETFFFHSFSFCLIFSPFFFLHARSAISMLKHFFLVVFTDKVCDLIGHFVLASQGLLGHCTFVAKLVTLLGKGPMSDCY